MPATPIAVSVMPARQGRPHRVADDHADRHPRSFPGSGGGGASRSRCAERSGSTGSSASSSRATFEASTPAAAHHQSLPGLHDPKVASGSGRRVPSRGVRLPPPRAASRSAGSSPSRRTIRSSSFEITLDVTTRTSPVRDVQGDLEARGTGWSAFEGDDPARAGGPARGGGKSTPRTVRVVAARGDLRIRADPARTGDGPRPGVDRLERGPATSWRCFRSIPDRSAQRPARRPSGKRAGGVTVGVVIISDSMGRALAGPASPTPRSAWPASARSSTRRRADRCARQRTERHRGRRCRRNWPPRPNLVKGQAHRHPGGLVVARPRR